MLTDVTNLEELLERYWDLEASAALWTAANEAKDNRITELEDEVTALRKRVARLSRLAVRQQSPRRSVQVGG
jgi:hypothetical protein